MAVDEDEAAPKPRRYYGGLEVHTPSTLPEVVPGPDSYPGKEFVTLDNSRALLHEAPGPAVSATPVQKRQRYRWIIGGVIVLIIVLAAVLISVGLLVIKKEKEDSNGGGQEPISTPSPDSGSKSDSDTGSSTDDAVLRGTRLATMGASVQGDIFLYYQSGDGGLHYISQSGQRNWQGSRPLPVKDAKLGTPLASTKTKAVSGGDETWWLFYVDESNTIQNVYSETDEASWEEGDVGAERYHVPNETNIAFTVHSGIEYNGERNGFFGGLSLYASDTEGVVHEYIYDESDRSWSDEQKLSKVDGFSGASAFWTSNSEYIFSLSETGSLQFHWRKYEKDDDNGDEDEDDEVDDWNIGPTSPAPVTENADICATHGFAFQAPDGTIRGSNFTYLSNASRARWDADYDISEGPAANGTSIACFYFFPSPNKDAEQTMFHVFYQVEDGKIVEAIRHWKEDNKTVPGDWSYRTVPIN